METLNESEYKELFLLFNQNKRNLPYAEDLFKGTKVDKVKLRKTARNKLETLVKLLTNFPTLIKYNDVIERLLETNYNQNENKYNEINIDKDRIVRSLHEEEIDIIIKLVNAESLFFNKNVGISQTNRESYFRNIEIYLRHDLSLCYVSVTKETLTNFADSIRTSLNNALVKGGFMAGSISADAIGAAETQKALDSFHTPGQIKKFTGDAFSSVTNLKEIKEPKDCISDILFDNVTSMEEAETVASNLPGVRLSDIASETIVLNRSLGLTSAASSRVISDTFGVESIIERIKYFYPDPLNRFDFRTNEGKYLNNFFIYILLDQVKMCEHRLSMGQVVKALKRCDTNKNLIFYYTPFHFAEIIITVNYENLDKSKIDVEEGNLPPVLTETNSDFYINFFLNSVLSGKVSKSSGCLKEVIIKGIRNIVKANVKRYDMSLTIVEQGFDVGKNMFYALFNMTYLRYRGISRQDLIRRLNMIYLDKVQEKENTMDCFYFPSNKGWPKEYIGNIEKDISGVIEKEEISGSNIKLKLKKGTSIDKTFDDLSDIFRDMRKDADGILLINAVIDRTSASSIIKQWKKDKEQYKVVLICEIMGTALDRIMLEPRFRPGTLTCYTSPKLTARLFGIEAARHNICHVLKQITEGADEMGGGKISPRHIELIADYMTCRGFLASITHAGAMVNGVKTMALATFERVGKTLEHSAVQGESEHVMDDPTLAFHLGLQPVIGTKFSKMVSKRGRDEIERAMKELDRNATNIKSVVRVDNIEDESDDDEGVIGYDYDPEINVGGDDQAPEEWQDE